MRENIAILERNKKKHSFIENFNEIMENCQTMCELPETQRGDSSWRQI